MTSGRLLCIFDIDGTLTPVSPAGARAMAAAFQQRFGRLGDPRTIAFAGRTDAGIFADYARSLGLPPESWRDAELLHLYGREVRSQLAVLGCPPLPGVRELVAALAAHPAVRLAVATGNLRTAAQAKLERLGLEEPLRAGAFGEEAEDRPTLVALALARAEAAEGHPWARGDVVVIGDALGDVQAARANGVRVAAVGTGPLGAAVAAARPDAYFPDLRDHRRAQAWLLGARSRAGGTSPSGAAAPVR